MPKTKPRVFYGWWIVLATALGLFLGHVPVLVFSFGVFLKPLAAEFHSGRGAVSLALTLHNIGSAIGVIVAGRMADRFGPRKVILPAMILTGLLLLASYLCPARLTALYAFFLALGFLGGGAGPVTFVVAISHWFDKRRGLALGTMLFGMGLGITIMPAIAQRLNTAFGWRFTYAATGAIILLIAFPVMSGLLINKPEEIGLLPDGAPAPSIAAAAAPTREDSGILLRNSLRTPAFWMLLSIFLIAAASSHACFGHIPAILTDRGVSPAAAAFALSLFGAGTLLGRTASGYLLDRLFAPYLGAVIFACAAAGVALLALTGSQPLAFAAAFLIGIGWGTDTDLKAYLVGRYFGLRSFGAIYGLIFAGFVLGSGLGAYLMGLIFDATHAYTLGLTLACIGLSVCAVLSMLLGPYRYGVGEATEPSPELESLATDSLLRRP